MAVFYKHSGAAPMGGVIRMVFAGLATAGTLAFIYGYAMVWIPFIYGSFLFPFGLGSIIGAMIGKAARDGHVRNVAVPAVVAIISGSLALYTAWGVDFGASYGWPEEESILTTFHPDLLLEYASWQHANGNKHGFTGIVAALVWLIEGGIIIGLATITSRADLGDLVFCEACGRWMIEESEVTSFAAEPIQAHLGQLEQGDLESLHECGAPDRTCSSIVVAKLYTCQTCSDTNYLTLNLVKALADRKGRLTIRSTALLNKLSIADTDVELVRNSGSAQDLAMAGKKE